jgi:hypothetical protein
VHDLLSIDESVASVLATQKVAGAFWFHAVELAHTIKKWMTQAEKIPMQLMAGGQIADIGEAGCNMRPHSVEAECCERAHDQRFEAKPEAY